MRLRRDVFQAIADPTRRDIIGLLCKGPMNVTQIVEQFQTTRQAVSIHIKLLKECGLLEIRQKGREKICVGKLQALDEVSNWVEVSRREWTARFRKLDNYLTEIKKNQHARKK